jgi:tRNA(Ile)-lysidine synthase
VIRNDIEKKMKKTEQKILKFIDDKKLITKNDRVLIALSGGPDSVSLFHFLIKYKKKFKIELGAVHINHKLRATDSDNDEKFCKELCGKFSIPFFVVRKDVKNLSKKKKMSLEEAGREVRYSEFAKIAKQNNYTKIATAHTCDDNA